jgi:hypothetical protein
MAQDDQTTQDIDRIRKLKKQIPDSDIQVDQNQGDPWNPPDQGPAPRQRVWPGSPTTPQQAGFSYSPNQPPPAPPSATPTQDSGGTRQGLMGQWDQFISHPEHRAGLMQFAVNMLSGRGLGESIGAAAEASGRNVAYQQEQERYEEAQALKEQEAARKERETDYYGQAVKRPQAGEQYYAHLAAREDQALRMQGRKEFNSWLQEPGGNDSGIMADVKKKFPNIKSKKDLLAEENGAAREYAAQRHGDVMGYAPASRAPAGPTNQPVYDKKTGALKGYWDGKKFTPGGPE